ncbi:MAG: hypothetical protein U9Q99_00040 [Nanoarchaeota archaeon]|nr:hypothetical protein [Nanoarchaeota archaeon]
MRKKQTKWRIYIDSYTCYTQKEYRKKRNNILDEENGKEDYKGKLCY